MKEAILFFLLAYPAVVIVILAIYSKRAIRHIKKGSRVLVVRQRNFEGIQKQMLYVYAFVSALFYSLVQPRCTEGTTTLFLLALACQFIQWQFCLHQRILKFTHVEFREVHINQTSRGLVLRYSLRNIHEL